MPFVIVVACAFFVLYTMTQVVCLVFFFVREIIRFFRDIRSCKRNRGAPPIPIEVWRPTPPPHIPPPPPPAKR